MTNFLICLGVYIVGCWVSYFYVRWKDKWLNTGDILGIVFWPATGVIILCAALLIGVPEVVYQKLYERKK